MHEEPDDAVEPLWGPLLLHYSRAARGDAPACDPQVMPLLCDLAA
jgi:hypothetical protein